jgi:hypothetical protein
MLYMQSITPALDWTLLSANLFESCGGHGNVQLSQSQREKRDRQEIGEYVKRMYGGIPEGWGSHSKDDQAEQDVDGGHGAQR